MAITNEYGDCAIVETHDNLMMEWIARGVTIRMGGASCIAEYVMNGADVKRTAVRNTLSLALRIGTCIREARENHEDPFDALLALLPETPYSHGRIIFKGKIVDVHRETRAGFAQGRARIEGHGGFEGAMTIDIRNENLIARVGESVRAVVPDLICVLDSETAEPVTTERLRYGQRVTVMGVSVPAVMRTPEALSVFGPAAFGLDVPFTPIESLSSTAGHASR